MPGIVLPKPSSLPEIPTISPEETKEKTESNESAELTVNQDDINMNHELRIQQIEAALLRIRGAI